MRVQLTCRGEGIDDVVGDDHHPDAEGNDHACCRALDQHDIGRSEDHEIGRTDNHAGSHHDSG
jgi:hypothetical protein